jgi:hypothetical protein
VTTTALVTAVYGGYDTPKPLPADHGFDDAVFVTDRPVEVEGWRVVVDPRPDAHPRLAAKRPKCLPWEYVIADRSVWIDGAYAVVSNDFRRAVDSHLDRHPLVVWTHPEQREGPWAEANFCCSWDKYRDWPVLEQATHYREQGLPDDYGLWACGTVARRHDAAERELGAAWMAEMDRWGIQDQVSLPFLLWQRDRKPGTWDVPQWSNPWLQWFAHHD